MTARKKAILALITANIIWGAASPIFKWSLENITPFTLAFLRFFGASLLVYPFVAHRLFIHRQDWIKVLLLSVLGITINITFFFFGLKYSLAINAPIISSSAPLFLYLASIFYLHEKPHKRVLHGMLIGLFGVLIIIIKPVFEKGLDGSVLGNLFFCLAMFSAIGHAIISKDVLKRNSSIVVTFWSFLIGSITFFPLFVYEQATYQPLASLDIRGMVGIVYGILFSSALAYTLFEWGLEKIDTQEVGLFNYVDPLVATIIAIPLLGEKVTGLFLFGSMLVFIGIFIAERRIHYHPLHKLRE